MEFLFCKYFAILESKEHVLSRSAWEAVFENLLASQLICILLNISMGEPSSIIQPKYLNMICNNMAKTSVSKVVDVCIFYQQTNEH